MTTANHRPTHRALPRWFGAALRLWGVAALALVAFASTAVAQTTAQKPNILVIMGDDIGWFNPSAYHQGIMGYQTPNIDRIAQEGARLTMASTSSSAISTT
jgi:arylsulfatase